ncbi:Ig-like domain-containing protein, partial [Vibrio jasicida]|uniref:Ig-like domain-containing protein n=2 Tax=Vibrio jasicida TaxID=766224 RepID=UPI0040688D73
TATFGGVQSNDATLTVTSAELVSIQVTPADKSIPKGTNQKYIATGTYTDNSTKDISTNVSWTSSDTDIATIVNGLASGVAEGETTITATFGGVQSNDATLTVTSAELVSIQISPVNESIPKGEDLEYLAIATYSDRSTKDVTASVIWISSDTSVATIVDGTAVGFKEGETKITASQGLITSNQATLTVTSAELVSIQVTPADKSIAKGLTQKYKALGRYTDNTSKDITASVSWLSSDANVATIVRGTATSIKEGKTKITASQGEITSNQAKLTVTSAELVSIQVTPAIQTIAKGQNVFYQADGRYTDGTVEDISKEVSWASTDVNVATIVLQGNSAIATGLIKGDTVISASLEGIISNPAELTVTDAITVSLQITPVRSSVPLGIDQQYEAIVTYSDATTADVTRQVSWNSSDLNVATITPEGKARTITKGTTEIEATFNGVISNSAELVVGDSVLVSILLTPDSAVHAVGDGRQYGAIASYSDGTSLPVMEQVDWFIDDASIATISDSGLLRAVSPGTTKIRVTMGSITSNESVITVTPAVVRFVEISPITESVAKGNRVQYRAQARMSTGMVTDVTDRVSWVSSNTTVATITSGGVAQGVTEGSVKISATLDGKDSNQADLTVTGAVISSIEITPQDASIIIGNTQQYVATAVYSDGSRVDATSNVNWVSSSVAATISTNGLATGVIQNRVTITANSNGVSSNRATLNVVRASLLSIEVEPKSASIPKGTTQQYLATGIYDNSSRVDITTQVTWTRGDGSVAAVSLTGLATGRNAGTTTIGAIFNGVTSLDADLIVTDAIVSSLKVTPESHSMDKGDKKQYTATGLYTDGSEVDLTKDVIWHIEQPTIASVNITGEAEGVGYGSTIIRATKGEERSNNATLTITDGRQLPIFEHYPWQWFPPQEYAWYVDRLGITPDGAFVENGEKGPDGMVVGLFTLEKANAVCNAITKPNTEQLFRWKVAPLEASQHLMTFNSNMYKKQGWAVGQYVWSPTLYPHEGKYMAISFEIRDIGSLDYPSELNYVACVRDFRATGDILV